MGTLYNVGIEKDISADFIESLKNINDRLKECTRAELRTLNTNKQLLIRSLRYERLDLRLRQVQNCSHHLFIVLSEDISFWGERVIKTSKKVCVKCGFILSKTSFYDKETYKREKFSLKALSEKVQYEIVLPDGIETLEEQFVNSIEGLDVRSVNGDVESLRALYLKTKKREKTDYEVAIAMKRQFLVEKEEIERQTKKIKLKQYNL